MVKYPWGEKTALQALMQISYLYETLPSVAVLIRRVFISAAARINLCTATKGSPLQPALLKIGDADARSVQKTPTDVLAVRRGLFFVKRQRRCIAYFQKIRF